MLLCSFQFSVVAFVTETWTAVMLQVFLYHFEQLLAVQKPWIQNTQTKLQRPVFASHQDQALPAKFAKLSAHAAADLMLVSIDVIGPCLVFVACCITIACKWYVTR